MPHDLTKTRKLRGGRHYGWGQVGQHRGSGMRGGVGRAGAKGHKFMMYEDRGTKKKGFIKKPLAKKANTVNVGALEHLLGKGKPEGGKVIIDMISLGYDKLLGSGIAPSNVEVIISSWSKRAEKKLLAVGSSVKKLS